MEKQLIVYPAVFDDSENDPGQYTITFPDIPGAISQADSIPEAMENAREVLGLMLYDVDELPEASNLKTIQNQYPNAVVTLVSENLSLAKLDIVYPSVKKNTTIPANLAYLAEEKGINFSKVLTDALKEKLSV